MATTDPATPEPHGVVEARERVASAGPEATAGLFVLMALAAGLSATALYLAHPLLHLLSVEYGLSPSQASWLVTGAQVGYAAGLFLVVPLGDIVRRGRLATTLLFLTAGLLVAVTVAVNSPMLIAATVAASLAAVGAQVLVPMAASLAPVGHSGRAVSTVMAGVLFGGLAGRALSGALADVAGWRSGYWVIAGLLVVTALILRRRLPADDKPASRLNGKRYAALLLSLATPLRDFPTLRRRSLVAGLAMASFSVQLAAVTLLLSADPFQWSTTAIGTFSLLAVIGVVLMPLTGRLADAGYAKVTVTVGLALELGAWILLLVTGSSILGLAVGLIALIAGQQAVMAATQPIVYALRPQARSRINAIFMTVIFAGGAAGSALAGSAWSIAGWSGACAVAITLAALALVVQLQTRGR